MIYLATKNHAKVDYVNAVLKQYGFEITHANIELPEPRSDDLRVIANHKVMHAYQQLKNPCVAIDSGFYIQSLNDFPKTFVNFALETIGLEGIIKLIENKNTDSEFRDCLAYYDSTLTEPLYFESATKGKLTSTPREGLSKSWSKLHWIFIPNGWNKTLSEMTEAEKLELRTNRPDDNFVVKFAKWLKNNKK